MIGMIILYIDQEDYIQIINSKEYESTVANFFSFVYRNYKEINVDYIVNKENYADVYSALDDVYINFE